MRKVRGNNAAVCLSCVLSVLLLFTGCLNEGGRSRLGDGHDFGANDPNTVLCMGDSITAGGFSGGAPWPARFAGLSGRVAINAGRRGETSESGAGRISSLLSRRKPGFVVIAYGANDAIRGVSLARTEQSLRSMVSRAKANQTIPILVTVLPMTGSRAIYNGRVDAINRRIREIARSEGVKLVNLHGAIRSDPDRYLVDGLHLNERGEELFANEIRAAFF